MDWNPIFLSLKLAAITTLVLFVVSIPLSLWLTKSQSFFKPILDSILSLPLVLPPTVLGFYFLMLFKPDVGLGGWLNETFNIQLVFSFPGLVIASIIYSLPFMVQPLRAGFEGLPKNYQEAAQLMGKSKLTILFKVLLPNMKPAVLSGIILSFAHTMGEFGVVLMMGGNIPNETKVASIAVYEQVEALNFEAANMYSVVLMGISFGALLLMHFYNIKKISHGHD